MLSRKAWAAIIYVSILFLLISYFDSLLSRCLIIATFVLFYLWLVPNKPKSEAIAVPENINDKKMKKKFFKPYSCDKVPENIDVIVIGSGMSGLTTAALLSRAGHKVLVLEQNKIAGGGTHTYSFKGYRFDSGFHYTVPWSGPLFELTCNTKKVPKFELLGDESGTFDKIILGDAKPFNIKHNEAHIKELYELFPEEKEAIDKFIKISNNALILVQLFIFSKLLPLTLQKIFWRLVPKKYTECFEKPYQTVLESLTTNKKLISLLCGLWIDTGGRPDEATFMLGASVFRGLPKEGGAYPKGGSDVMALTLVPFIESYGGAVLVKMKVESVLINEKNGEVTGVLLANGDEITAKMVISSVGYHNTFGKLISEEILPKYGIPKELGNVQDASGFVLCNIGIKGNPKELNIPNCNLWYHPVDKNSGDIFPPLKKFFDDPFNSDLPMMITFPSLKDSQWQDSDRISVQILIMANYDWFSNWKDSKKRKTVKDYQDLKKNWETKCLDCLYRVLPQVKGLVDFSNISTPLSIQKYLASSHGSAVGLAQTPERYSWKIQQYLDVKTPIKGFYMTGQDTLICGVTLAQIAGVITSFRIIGFFGSLKIVLQSIFFIEQN